MKGIYCKDFWDVLELWLIFFVFLKIVFGGKIIYINYCIDFIFFKEVDVVFC